MQYHLIKMHAEEMESAKKAIDWLKEHGLQFIMDGGTKVSASGLLAASCPGAPEAHNALNSALRSFLPDAIRLAIETQKRTLEETPAKIIDIVSSKEEPSDGE